MWEWLMQQLKSAAKSVGNYNDKDDIIAEVLLQLLEDKNLATKIYKSKNVGILYAMLKYKQFELNSKYGFENKIALSRYLRIINCCEKYGIEPVPENAYKIVALIEDFNNNFSIEGVRDLLKFKQGKEGILI